VDWIKLTQNRFQWQIKWWTFVFLERRKFLNQLCNYHLINCAIKLVCNQEYRSSTVLHWTLSKTQFIGFRSCYRGPLLPTGIFWRSCQSLVTACLVYVVPNHFSKGQNVIYWQRRCQWISRMFTFLSCLYMKVMLLSMWLWLYRFRLNPTVRVFKLHLKAVKIICRLRVDGLGNAKWNPM
jgi:hypothetical protein